MTTDEAFERLVANKEHCARAGISTNYRRGLRKKLQDKVDIRHDTKVKYLKAAGYSCTEPTVLPPPGLKIVVDEVTSKKILVEDN